jgi:hypothetical protein
MGINAVLAAAGYNFNAPTLVRGAFTRPFVDPLAPPLGRPVSPNPIRKTFFTAD